ncbi:hypothetical protein Tco_1449315 [Tanacetum coccineum]
MSANDNFSLHDDEELSLHDDASLDGSVPASNKGDAPAKPPQIITTNTLSNIKLPVLQKDDYDTWAMEMEHYLEYIDNEVWKVIQNGNSKKRVTKGKDGVYRVLPPTTQEEQFADEKERKARTLLLMAVPKDHLRRFHGMDDAKEIWAAIKTRFGGNANSKKMQKAVLKQQFEAFTISSKESLEKGYDRFQKLLSQLDALGAGVSDEDANHKFLRSLPPAWDSLAMTMRTKKNIDTLSIDDLYNNLSVFEQDIQKTSSSSLTSDNVAFLSQAKASSSKHKPSHSSGSYSSYTTSSSKATPTATPGLADEVIHSFLATNADDVDLIHEDLDQIDDLDLEEMDINWQIAMTAIKIKKFYKKTGRRPRVDGKMHVAFDKRKAEASIEQTTDEELNHALMAFTVNNEVSMCSKLCLDSYNALQAKYDELQSEFGDQEAALVAHKLAVKKLESQLKASHKQQSSLTEKLNFQANQIFEKDEKLKKYRRIGMKAVKDKDALQQIFDSCPIESDASSTVYSTCPSNDSDGEQGTVSDHSVNDDPIPIPSIEQTRIGIKELQWGLSWHQFKSGASSLYGEQHVNSGSVHVNSGTHIKSGSSRFNTGKQNVSSGSVRVNSGTQIKSGASRFNTGKQHVSSGRVNRPVSNNTSPKPFQVNLNSPKKCFSKQRSLVNRPFLRNTAHKSNIYAVKGKMGTAVKTSAGCVWRKTTPLSNTNSGPTLDSNVNDHPLKHMEHRGIFDSGCSGHMTGNRAHLEDYQELSKVGSVTFGGSKGSISGKAISPSVDHEEEVFSNADDDEMPEIRIHDKSSEGIFEKASYDDDGIISDFNNLPDEVDVPTNHTLRIHNAHP